MPKSGCPVDLLSSASNQPPGGLIVIFMFFSEP